MPAAAVIPAPIVYIIVAVVKKLVVGFRNATVKARPSGVARLVASFLWVMGSSSGEIPFLIVYFEKISAFKAGVLCLE